MLRFRMKMLYKKNLMTKTGDIGSCLGLLTGKLLVIGFVVGAFSANAMDKEFTGYNHQKAQVVGTRYKKERDVFKRQAELLQAQLAAQPAPGTASIDIASIQKALLSRIDEGFEEGQFDSPIKKSNDRRKRFGTPGNSKLRGKIKSIAIDIDSDGMDSLALVEATRTAVTMQCLSIFKEYMEQSGTDKENLSVVVRSGGHIQV